jgi:outer membrane protein
MKRKGSISLLLMYCISFGVFAQESVVLTLEESVAHALQKNPDYKTAEKEIGKASAGVLESYSNVLPKLNASVNYQRTWEIQTSRIQNFFKTAGVAPDGPDYLEISFGIPHTLTYGATVTQPVFLGGAGIAGIKMAYAAEDVARQNLEAKRQNLIYQTANAFYSCLLAHELVDVQEEALKQAQANLDVVLKKYDVGSASGFDKMRAQVEVANLRPQVIAAKNDLETAYTRLRMIIGMESEKVIAVSGQLEYKTDDFGAMEQAQLLEMAKNTRPERQVIDAQKKISKSGITIAFGNFLPKVFFQTDLSYLGQKDQFKFNINEDFSKGFYSAISVQVPIFQGFKSISQYLQLLLFFFFCMFV